MEVAPRRCHVENISAKSVGDGERIGTDTGAVLKKLYVAKVSTAQGALRVLLQSAVHGAVKAGSSCIASEVVTSCLEAGLAPARHNTSVAPLSAHGIFEVVETSGEKRETADD